MGKLKEMFTTHPVGASLTAGFLFAVLLQPLSNAMSKWISETVFSGGIGVLTWCLDRVARSAALASPYDLNDSLSGLVFGTAFAGLVMSVLLSLPRVVSIAKIAIDRPATRFDHRMFWICLIIFCVSIVFSSLTARIAISMRRSFEYDLSIARFGMAPQMEALLRARAARASSIVEWNDTSQLVKTYRAKAEAMMDRQRNVDDENPSP